MKPIGKILIMGAMAETYAQTSIKNESHYFYENPYAKLGEPLMYEPTTHKTYRKSNLTPKQKKLRNKAKNARKARKANRK